MIALSRIVWLVTGFLWVAGFAIDLTNANYLEPTAALDWIALWSWSVASVMLGASVLLVARLSSSRPAMITAAVVAGGGVTAGVANGLEDGYGITEMGLFYVLGFAAMWFGLMVQAIVLAQSGHLHLAALSFVMFIGVTLFPVGGAFAILAALSSVALAPTWFSTSTKRGVPAVADGVRD